jgi:hypothetical protein
MSRNLGIRHHTKRTGEKFAYAVPLSSSKRGVAYCTSDEALARLYATRSRYSGEPEKGAVGRGATCTDAKKAALTALRSGKLAKPLKRASKPAKRTSVAACVAACKRRSR